MSGRRDATAEALADCLRSMDEGATPSEALARHPGLQAELEPMVASAAAVRALPPRSPRPAYRAALQRELVRLETQRTAETGAVTGAGRRTLLLRAAASFAALVVVLGVLVVASADSRPGDALYPVRGAFGRLAGVERVLRGWQQSDASPSAEPSRTARPDGLRGDTRLAIMTPSVVARLGGNAAHLKRNSTPTAVVARDTMAQRLPPIDYELVVVVVEPAPTATAVVPTPAQDAAPTASEANRREHMPSPTDAPRDRNPPATDPPPTSTSVPSATSTSPGGAVAIIGSAKLADGGAGRPLPGLIVSVYRAPTCPIEDRLADYLHYETRTDTSGAYAVQVPPGVYVISVGGRTDDDECLPVSWFVDSGPVVESDDPCGVATNIDLSRGISAPLGYPLVYASDVATTCP